METQEEYKALVKTELSISIADVKKYIAPNATDKELFMFMGICKSYGLNPFKREIHFVKYGTTPASIIVGYENYLKRAERTGKLDGWKCWIDKDDIGEKAIIEIKRKDQSNPIHWEVYRKEFDKQQSTWKTMPTFMLKKVAIAQGFRLAFPDDLGGMPYIPEELPQTKDTTSENLSKDAIDVKEETSVDDAPDFQSLPGDVSLDTKSPLHKKIEVLISEAGIDRELFKEWLGCISWIKEKEGRLSLSTLSEKNAKSLVDKWDSAQKTFNAYVDAKNQPGKG